MGGRLSRPRGPDGMSEGPKPSPAEAARLTRSRGIINGRTVMAPLAALTMAALLFVYTRTSIKAAKLNAQRHREADGGQISWHKESLRRHGQLDKVEGSLKEALLGDLRGKKAAPEAQARQTGRVERSEDEAELRKMLGKKD